MGGQRQDDFTVKTGSSKDKQNTREKILHTIKSRHEATVGDLADAADVSPVTVRHHLNTLQAEGAIEAKAVRRDVGRPHYVYSLSEAGEELFPQKYFRLSSRLLDELKKRFPLGEIASIFEAVAHGTLAEHRGKYEKLSFENKLDYLVELLAEEGFLARWRRRDDRYELTEYSCPYMSIGETHTEVCTFDKGLMLQVLNTSIKQNSCMLQGDACCLFTIAAPAN